MRLFFVLIYAFTISTGHGQSIQPGILSTTGNQVSQASLTLQWTMGEVAIQSFEVSALSTNEGFHQLFNEEVNTPVSELKLSQEILLFPNPTSDQLNIQTETQEELHFKLFNSKGQLKKSGMLNRSGQLEVEHLPEGHYHLLLTNNKKEQGLYTFVKS